MRGFLRRARVVAVLALLVVAVAMRLRASQGWVFVGPDSDAYTQLAVELRQHGRYALSPEDPPHWFRPPLYPLLLAAVRLDPEADPLRRAIVRPQIVVDALGTGALVLALGHAMAGWAGGLLALLCFAVYPLSALSPAAVLTECLAAFLTTCVVAIAIFGRGRSPRWLVAGGLTLGLSALLRQDGLLVGVALVPLVLSGARAIADRRAWALAVLRRGALVLAGLGLVYGPWLARNLWTFGAPHVADGHVDRTTRPVAHYRGYFRWVRTWARDFQPTQRTLACFFDPGCKVSTFELAMHRAFETQDDFDRVARLIQLRNQVGVTAEVDAGFDEMARELRARHPGRVWVLRPASRAWEMWTSGFNELLGSPRWLPWPALMRPFLAALPAISRALTLAFVASLLVLALSGAGYAAAVLSGVVILRTLVLAYSAYCLPRYLEEVTPIVLTAIAAATVLLLLRSWARARRVLHLPS